MDDTGVPRHGGEHLRWIRERAGLSIDEVAARAGVEPGWLSEVERTGTGALAYQQIAALVRATQPPRPAWWDEGHEHDLALGPNGHGPPRTEEERRYWANIEAVRRAIRARSRHEDRHGRAASA